MNTGYTPTTEQIRDMAASSVANYTPQHQREGYEMFDAWLAAHDRKVKAEVLRDAAWMWRGTDTEDPVHSFLHTLAAQIEADQ